MTVETRFIMKVQVLCGAKDLSRNFIYSINLLHIFVLSLQKRRVNELLCEDVPEDEVHLMKNGR